jgi:hypothetical protein
MLPFNAVTFAFFVLFVPETSYNRDAIYNIDTSSEQRLDALAQIEKGQSSAVENNPNTTTRTLTSERSIPPRKTFVQSMAIYTGTYSKDPLWKMVLSSLVIMANLGALWVIVVQGLVVAWYVAVSIVSAQIFAPPPYNMNASQIGFISTGPLIGCLLGSLVGSALSDSIAKFMTRKNRGI